MPASSRGSPTTRYGQSRPLSTLDLGGFGDDVWRGRDRKIRGAEIPNSLSFSLNTRMARYIQRIALLGKDRWIGWEVDGIGTEIPGLTLADEMSDEELRARGIKEFHQLTFESFLELGSAAGNAATPELLDEDIAFRLDALQ